MGAGAGQGGPGWAQGGTESRARGQSVHFLPGEPGPHTDGTWYLLFLFFPGGPLFLLPLLFFDLGGSRGPMSQVCPRASGGGRRNKARARHPPLPGL